MIWDEIPTLKTLIGSALVIISSIIIFRREFHLINKFLYQDMSKPPIYWSKAKKNFLKGSRIKKIFKKYNKGYLTTRNKPFFSICRTIVGQQISTKAADSIWNKFD